jgi:hypothetical protein
MTPKQPPREQEQSIRARKEELYDEQPAPARPVGTEPKKPFAVYVRETPAAPLSGLVKAALWAVGAVVVLLLIATLLRGSR